MPKNLLKTNSFINNYKQIINEINSFEANFKTLSNNELRSKNIKLQREYQKTNNLNNLLVESFALTREASLRTLGLRHFDVQLIGGLVLNNQKLLK